MTKQSIIWSTLFAVALFILFAGSTSAAVSEEEAGQLGTTLTEFGAEKGGNADGSIPAYTGGLPTCRAGADRYEDPFKGEKPLFTIDAKNVSKYDSILTTGTRALIKRFPETYKIDVYPAHRTVCYPSWVIQNTLKNAGTAKIGGEIEGDAITGVDEKGLPFNGIPFPIPKNGYEVMWNSKLHIAPPVDHNWSSAAIVDTAGRISTLPEVNHYYLHPWYEKSGDMRRKASDAVLGISSRLTSPPSSAGTKFLLLYMPDAAEGGQRVWLYTPGKRHIGKAPEFSYDIPITAYSGSLLWDEMFGFVGRMDRFDFKLIGKKEIIIPYNVFGLTNHTTLEEVLGPRHVKPNYVRWEKHRVWVVDSVRKSSAHHLYSRRTFYMDEDSWCILSTESYDNSGKMWRVAYIYTFPTYDVFGVNNASWSFNDLIKGNYSLVNAGRKMPGKFVRSYAESKSLDIPLSPQAVEGSGVR
ncbi:MAG: DUF1329 domain-containing protein [Syntrophales bacterium]